MPRDWLREASPDLAGEKILDAAEKTFGRLGVSAAGMAEIAEAAGCSRGTLYRYFKTRHELHLAYVKRAGLRIAERVHARIEGIDDPSQVLVQYILSAVHEVRSNPGTAAWFVPGVSGMAARMSQSPQMVEALTGAVGSLKIGSARRRADRDLQARWLVRVIVSLLSDPAADEAEERRLIERFVAPIVLLDQG